MPELPEVETIRLGLEKYLIGKKILGVEVRLRRIFSGDEKNIIGAKITSVDRFGKGLVINLSNGYSIAAHIKLTGQLIYRGPEISKTEKLSPKVGKEIPNKFTHAIFKLKTQNSKLKNTRLAKALAKRANQNSKVKDEDAHLYYNDIRQFGWIKIVKSDKIKEISFFKDLGPEPPVAKAMEGQALLTLEKFKEIVSRNSVAIKPLIMDQKKIGGIGNIYANDALFDSQINPRRKAKSLKPEETRRLYNSILKVLKKGLENGGASELNYVNALGQEGRYQHHFLAYAKAGKKCVRCGNIMKKITLGGRGTYFCPNCQK